MSLTTADKQEKRGKKKRGGLFWKGCVL